MASPQAAALQLLQDFQQLQSHRAELYSRMGQGFREFLGSGQEGLLAQLMAKDITPGFTAVSQQVIAIESCLKSSAVARPDLAALLRQVQELERDKLRLTLSWQALRAAHASGRFSWQSEADRPRLSSSKPAQQQQQQAKQDVAGMLQQMQLRAGSSAAGAARVSNDIAAVGALDQHSNGALQQQQQQQQQEDGFMSVKPGFYEQQLQQAAAAAAVAEHVEQDQQQQGHSHSHGCCSHAHGDGHDHGPPDPLDAGSLEPTEAEYSAAVREALQQLDECVVCINEVLQEVQEAVAELQQE